VIVWVTPRRALFLVGGQLRRSRSAQLVRVMRVALISSRRFMAGVALMAQVVRLFLRVSCPVSRLVFRLRSAL
jgi:hypothetical protein